MTEPVTPPAPAEPAGVVAHIEKWFESHLALDVAAVKGDAKTALQYVAEHAANVNALANLVLKLIQAADPAAAPAVTALSTEAERITADTARVAGELATKM